MRVPWAWGRDRWRQVGIVGAAAASVLALAGVAVALSGVFGSDGPGAIGPRVAPLRASLPPLPSTLPGRPACRSPLTPAEPLRLWIAGDSLAGSLGPALGKFAAETGVVAPVFDSRVSSGLANPSFFDWPQHAGKELARLDPEIVVFIIGANDWSAPSSLPVDEKGEPVWRARYAAAVDQMLQLMLSGGRRVFWVGAPVMQDPAKDRGVRQVNEVARARVEQNPDATFVDAYKLFADDSGRYVAILQNAAGRRVRVRTDDGVHFTPDGADLIGSELFRYLDERCHLAAQAVPGAAKPVIETSGSGSRGTGTTPTDPVATSTSVSATTSSTKPSSTSTSQPSSTTTNPPPTTHTKPK